MILKKYHQHFHYADIRRFKWYDALYIACALLVFGLLRGFPIARLLGGLFVR